MCMSLFTPGLHDGNLYIDLETCLWLNKQKSTWFAGERRPLGFPL